MSENLRQWRDEAPHSYARYVNYQQTVSLAVLPIVAWLAVPDTEWTDGAYADAITPFQKGGHKPPGRTPADLRAEFLEIVKTYVTKDRNATHGDAEDNFADIADMWNIMFGKKLKEPLNKLDVAAGMICVKLSRIKSSPNHLDHWQDTAGYSSCGGGIIMKEGGK
jgi:hypothetical protein